MVKTPDSDSGYQGSSPCNRTIPETQGSKGDFESSEESSSLSSGTIDNNINDTKQQYIGV